VQDDGIGSGHGGEPDYEREHEPARKSIALSATVIVIGVFIVIDHHAVAFRVAEHPRFVSVRLVYNNQGAAPGSFPPAREPARLSGESAGTDSSVGPE
jgi:hypothetical protein